MRARRVRLRSRSRRLITAGGLALTVLGPGRAFAQQGDGYLFRPPVGSLTVRGGYQVPATRSDFWSFTTEQLTLGRRQLAGLTIGGDLSGRINDRWSWQLSADLLSRGTDSEYRRFEEQLANGTRVPIRQRTEFRRLPITFGWRYDLRPDGERIGQFAWMPSRVAPYVMGGGGASWYSFRQRGDFVNFDNANAIFTDDFTSSGWGLVGYVGAGVDISLNTVLALSTQLRAVIGNAPLRRDFRGFEPLDLSGAMLTTGIRLRLP
ncbi:MAG: hypothetical protein MUF53_10155 [Gemmatimonadaceae bacterium]|nr:hypothetical protein [Gemmatimonadaceae bacterium]